jgi:hypothetical protein
LEAVVVHHEHDGDKPDSARTPHLLCGSRFWPISASLGCVYLAWLAYARLASHQFAWPNDTWSVLAYAVWVVFLLVVTSESHCVRERLLFTILIANFALGLCMAAARGVQPSAAQTARQISLSLWILGALYGASFMFRSIPAPLGKTRKA